MKAKLCVIGLWVILALAPTASAQDHWVGTWGAARQAGRGGPPPAAPAAPGVANAAAPAAGAGQRGNPAPIAFKDQTVRMVVRTSLGGKRARVTLSNAYGPAPLTIGSAHVAL